MTDEHEEGWYTDPYGRHEARWMSAGSPTKLVRDGNIECYEDPPDEEPRQVATKIVPEPPPGAARRRADDAEAEVPTKSEVLNAAVFGAVSTWHLNQHNPDDPRNQ